jgi:L-histidine N-alpha-methyltransferase
VPKALPPKWFYDDRGSALFTEITRLPEYYLTRAERSILIERSDEIARLTGADTLVELGSGTSEKTRLLLNALTASGRLRRFVALDVSEATLRESAAHIAAEYAGVDVVGIVGDYERHLRRLPSEGLRLIALLGSSIGNLPPRERASFLSTLRSARRAEWLLLGVDLVKEASRLEAAYDDAIGVTAQFNRNVLAVLNRELNADFDLRAFEHIARYDQRHEWVEMRLRSLRDQVVRIGALGLAVQFVAGEELLTEISAKFRRESVARELGAAGFAVRRFWTDRASDFGLVLAEA